MDVTGLSILILMLVSVVLATGLLMRVQDWRAAIAALQLRWEREQRQAGSSEVMLTQRQSAQTRFEELVSQRPLQRLVSIALVVIALLALSLALSWDLDDLGWTAIWLIAPLGAISAVIMLYSWFTIRTGQQQLAAISMTLYGPPPPRVKVRSIKVSESAQE